MSVDSYGWIGGFALNQVATGGLSEHDSPLA